MLSLLLFGSCNKSEDPEGPELSGTNITAASISLLKVMGGDTGGIGEDQESILYCHFDQTIGFDKIVVRTETEFQALTDAIKSKGACYSEKIPEIDFSKYTLIGKYVSDGGCRASFDNQVYNDEENKTITYHIKANFSGECQMFLFSWNWMLIPKIANDYAVVFEVENKD